MFIRQLFDADTSTYTYVVADTVSKEAVLIDPVLGQADRDAGVIRELGMTLTWVVETHIHADHITAASVLRDMTGCRVAVPEVNAAPTADRTLAHGATLAIGTHHLKALATPGHTEGSMSYVTSDNSAVFTGDSLMIRACGRTDFQGGSAADMYHSVHTQLYTLPNTCTLYPGHNYAGLTASSIGEEKAHNPRIAHHIDEATFIKTMDALDLPPPRKLDVAVPANMRLGAVSPTIRDLPRGGFGARQATVSWMLNGGQTVRRIDVREADEYTGPLGHIPETQLVPLATLPTVLKDWTRDEPLLIICRSGKRSDRGALALEDLGFTNVASLEGGTIAYNQHVADSPHSAGCA